MGLTLGMVVVFSSLCFAALPSSSMELGEGNIVVSKYKFGAPNINGDKFYFANGVVVEFDKRHSQIVEEIGAKSDSSVAVGMSEKVLNEHYGAADLIEKSNDNNVDYVYFSDDGKNEMVFKVSDGVIEKIECDKR